MFHSILPWIETSLIITGLFKQKETVEAPWSSVTNILNYYVVTELNQKSKKGTHVSTILSINTAIAHQSQKLSILFLCINSNCQKIQQHPIPLGLTYNLPFQYMSVFEKTRIYFSHFQYEDHVKLIRYKKNSTISLQHNWFLISLVESG